MSDKRRDPRGSAGGATSKTAAAPRSAARRWTFRGGALLLAVMVAALLAELAVMLLVRGGALSTPPPARPESAFWEANRPDVGVWHRPLATLRHQTECFDVTYRTNSVGARDAEREREAGGPRTVVLGDSMVEGWGVSREKRLSDLLEQATGREHLNFGMSHFGPYQNYLVYRELAKSYEHDSVLASVFPLNDFADLDYELAVESPPHEFHYRPYLVGEGPDYRRIDHFESRVRQLLRRHSYAYNAAAHAIYSWRRRGKPDLRPPSKDASGLVHSYFYDFTERQFDLLRHSLELLVAEAEGKRVAVLLIPAHRDLVRYHQSGESPLQQRLGELAAQRGFRLVNLLPAMHDYTPHWDEFHLSCDFHWNDFGHAVAARIVERELVGVFYEPRAAAGP